MICGHATPTGTTNLADQHPDLKFNPLGSTGLLVSGAGFGGYRINAGVTAHGKALKKALTSGINLIDTSSNYADGGSERLVGQVLDELIEAGRIAREQVVVVTKGGYLQGGNYALSQQRRKEGHPFEDLVEYGEGLEHCIHPDFLDDQIGRSLDRLGMDSLDGYLLHNPEYYLGWAHKNGLPLEAARAEYDRRIEAAFTHLEKEVERGRIRFYGISSNTFPAAADDPEFTAFHRVWEIAASVAGENHFKVIQLPFNLFEPGAAVEANQPNGQTVLGAAVDKNMGLLVNRALNAFTRRRMIRLADVEVHGRMDYKEIIQRIKDLARSETRLWRKILPAMEDIPAGLKVRIKQQACFAESLKHHWRSFGSYERWREAKDGIFLPRIQGVVNYLNPLAEAHPDLAGWIASHEEIVGRALRAVASIYADDVVALQKKIRMMIDRADEDWSSPGTLSQKALRALVSTLGVSAVLIGMRQEAYVDDVLAELHRPVPKIERTGAWKRLHAGSREIFPT
jgi:hypothetical protein